MSKRAINVVRSTLAITASGKSFISVDGVGENNRANGVVKVEMLGAGEFADILGQGLRRKGASSDDAGPLWNFSELFTYDFDLTDGCKSFGDLTREATPVDGERLSCRDAIVIGGRQEQRVETPHFFVQ